MAGTFMLNLCEWKFTTNKIAVLTTCSHLPIISLPYYFTMTYCGRSTQNDFHYLTDSTEKNAPTLSEQT